MSRSAAVSERIDHGHDLPWLKQLLLYFLRVGNQSVNLLEAHLNLASYHSYKTQQVIHVSFSTLSHITNSCVHIDTTYEMISIRDSACIDMCTLCHNSPVCMNTPCILESAVYNR